MTIERERNLLAYREECSPVETCAEARKDDGLAAAKSRLGIPFGGCDEHGSGGSVSVSCDIRKKLFGRNFKGASDPDDQILIRLMHDERVDCRGLPLGFVEHFANRGGDFAGSLHDYRTAVHLDRGIEFEAEGGGIGSIRVEFPADQFGKSFIGINETGTSAVAEQDRGIFIIADGGGHFLRGDEQNLTG